MNNSDIEVVGSDCMCELGSDKHKEGCEYTNSGDSTHSTKEAYQNTIEELSKEHDLWKDAKETSLTFGKGFIFDEKEWWLNKITEALKATREEVVEQWRKSIDEEGLSCARKIEEAVKEERERIAQLIYDILPTNKVIKESAVGWGKEGTDRYKGYLSGAKDVSGLVSWEITSFAKELKIEALTEVNNDNE